MARIMCYVFSNDKDHYHLVQDGGRVCPPYTRVAGLASKKKPNYVARKVAEVGGRKPCPTCFADEIEEAAAAALRIHKVCPGCHRHPGICLCEAD